MASADEKALIKELDGWIEQLYLKKQLAENQVKTLCEKVQTSKSYQIINGLQIVDILYMHTWVY